jgi:murein DD-endopeptidase MepM/ murein hydrolase activator NlpD
MRGRFGAGSTVAAMTTFTAHISRGARRRTALMVSVLAAATVVLPLIIATPRASAADSSYRWPVKPFDRPHPVRANFGDPRTTFAGPATTRTLMTSPGIFQFHFGIDIAVPDGTAVYPVRSGIARLQGGRTVSVDSGGGFVAEYWHIVPTVKPGQQVVAFETVLGHVMKGYEHVHFSELDHGIPVNPLAPGHLAPYDDATAPQVRSMSFRESDTGPELIPEFLHGRVVMIADAYDMPALQVSGTWNTLPVAPALVTWHIERARDGQMVLDEQTAFDVRSMLPPQAAFWQYYARGTRQNMCTFDVQRSWRTPGVYLYKLTREPFDTARLANGIYRLVVTATDTRGNRGSSSQPLIVRNGRR